VQAVRLILNVIWLVFCGLWMALAYVIAGLICFVLIITIPFGIGAFRIANYVLWPFGRTIEPRRHAGVGSVIGNIIWIVLFGWWLALGHRRGPVPDHHRHPARPGQLQDHPDHAAAARRADRPHRPAAHPLGLTGPRPAGNDIKRQRCAPSILFAPS
jgi:hypothetical protein